MSDEPSIPFDYPDLSDQEPVPREKPCEPPPESEPRKRIKTNEDLKAQRLIITPSIFGSKPFIPPPPPPGSSLRTSQVGSAPQATHKKHGHFDRVPRNELGKDRERRSCVFVRNIPRHFNESLKLMTFFKNEGAINEIRTNQQQLTATVRFAKEESAIKFANSGKCIFNRSYITYSLNEKDQVPPELIRERQNDENGQIKRPIEIELKHLKEKMEASLADKLRAIYFLRRHVKDQSLLGELADDQQLCLTAKLSVGGLNEVSCKAMAASVINEYDWTLCFQTSMTTTVDKKEFVLDLQNKYGPVANVDFRLLKEPVESEPGTLCQESSLSQYQYVVKLTFVGVRSSWLFFTRNSQIFGSGPGRVRVDVEGKKMNALFVSGLISPAELCDTLANDVAIASQVPAPVDYAEELMAQLEGRDLPIDLNILPANPIESQDTSNGHKKK